MRKFSVIIPAFNSAKYLPETINSVFQQTYSNFEIIVVNDGSTDDSLSILAKYQDSIKVINQQNSGVSSTRNNGAQAATGDVLAFLDADDLWMPDKLFFQNRKLDQGFDIAYTNRMNFGVLGYLPEIHSDMSTMKEGDIWEDLLFENVIATSSLVVSKDVFEEFNGFNESMSHCEDWDLWLKFAEKYPIGYNPEPLIKYRVHMGGLSKNYRLMSQRRNEIISKALAGSRGKEFPFRKRRALIANTFSCSAWEAAICKDYYQSLKFYLSALSTWPFDSSIWYSLARLVFRRI